MYVAGVKFSHALDRHVRVVVGEYCYGRTNALTPDVRDQKTQTLYDSTVDSTSNPSIYVTYHDAQGTYGSPLKLYFVRRVGRCNVCILLDELRNWGLMNLLPADTTAYPEYL